MNMKKIFKHKLMGRVEEEFTHGTSTNFRATFSIEVFQKRTESTCKYYEEKSKL